MPNRIIRDGILTSERVDKLGPVAEVFYRRLMSVVDDFGRYTAHTGLLRAACYPLRVDSIREADITRLLAEVQQAGLIVLYEVKSKQYLEIVDFKQQVRAKLSKFPCAADAQQMISDAAHMKSFAHLDVFGGVSVFGGEDGVVNAATHGTRETFLTGPSPASKRFREVYPRKAKPAEADRQFAGTVAELVGMRGMTDAAAEEFLIDRAEAFAASPAGMPPPPGQSDDFRPEPANWLKAGRFDEPVSEWQKPNVKGNTNGPNANRRSDGRASRKGPTERTAETVDLDALFDELPVKRLGSSTADGI